LIGIVTFLCWFTLVGQWPGSFLAQSDKKKPPGSSLRSSHQGKSSKEYDSITPDDDDDASASIVVGDDDDLYQDTPLDDDDHESSTSTTTPTTVDDVITVAGDDYGDKLQLDEAITEPSASDDDETDQQPKDDANGVEEPGNHPDVAWIVSFGGSGTSYTILNIEAVTGQSTASNYAQDFHLLVPVKESYVNGPYVRSPHKPLPPKYILTKTHCGGYCMDCSPSTYVYESAFDFQKACRTAFVHVDGKEVDQVYEAEIPKRAVHLVRSPFDNLVGRFHLSVKRQRTRTGVDAELLSNFSDTAEGLENWCQYLDRKYVEQESHYEVLHKYRDVPCHAEWFRYIQWHNLVDMVLRDLDIPVHYLWYHNYTSEFNQTVDNLLDFLSLERHDNVYPWKAGHSYRPYFTQKMTNGAISMMKDLASANTWRLIKDYFAEYTDIEMLYDTPEELLEEESNIATEDDDVADEKETVTTMMELNLNDPDPQVVWLLSFPNSVC
jgi:hypothetical protein